MFYSQYVLAKKSVLGRVWMAAHWERKLSKQQVIQTDLVKSVEFIMRPDAPLALRLSGHLLLGVTRIFARKVGYLQADCQDAMVKIKMAFRGGPGGNAAIDLGQQVPLSKITLPDPTDIDLERLASESARAPRGTSMPNLADLAFPEEDLLELQVDGSASTARKELIPISHDIGASFGTFEGFGGDDLFDEFVPVGMSQPDDGFEPMRAGEPSVEVKRGDISNLGGGAALPSFDDDNLFDASEFRGFDQPFETSGFDAKATPMKGRAFDDSMAQPGDLSMIGDAPLDAPSPSQADKPSFGDWMKEPSSDSIAEQVEPNKAVEAAPARPSRKRKAVKVDEALEISAADYREMLNNPSSIVADIVGAPPSKRAMHDREREQAGPQGPLKNFFMPGLAPELLQMFTRNMTDVADAAQAAAAAAAEGSKLGLSFDDQFAPIGYDSFAPDAGEFGEPWADFGGPDPMEGSFGQDPPVAFGPPSTVADTEMSHGDDGGADPRDAAEGSRPDDGGVSQRTHRMHNFLRGQLQPEEVKGKGKKVVEPEVSFLGLVEDSTRNVVVSTFLELLVLAGKERIRLAQGKPYGDILISRGDRIEVDLSVDSDKNQ